MVMVPHRLWPQALVALLVFLPLIAPAQEPPQEAFIELSASNDEVYVQQQLLLTVKLYYTNQVVQGQLSDPEHPDAVIEKLGEQKQYREQVDGERYRVVERDYVIFPQTPGRLQLPPLEFQGTARHPQGHHYRIADSAELFPVSVKDIPPDFSGDTWLPATGVSLGARGLERAGPVESGDNLTRTLTLTARGLPATTLPALDIPYPDEVRSYPEPAQRQSSAGGGGVIGELQQTTALVPVPDQGGTITLPEIRIPWWDVTEDREKVAIVPARTLHVVSTAGAAAAEPPRGSDLAADDPSSQAPEGKVASGTNNWLWPIVAGLLLIGWMTTAAAWWLQRRRPGQALNHDSDRETEKARFNQLCHLARNLDPAFFNHFPAWGQELTGRTCRTTDDALARLADDHLTQMVRQWRGSLFGPSGEAAPEGTRLKEALESARTHWRKTQSQARGKGPALPNLYPEGLTP